MELEDRVAETVLSHKSLAVENVNRRCFKDNWNETQENCLSDHSLAKSTLKNRDFQLSSVFKFESVENLKSAICARGRPECHHGMMHFKFIQIEVGIVCQCALISFKFLLIEQTLS